jgi:hypothetical protein
MIALLLCVAASAADVDAASAPAVVVRGDVLTLDPRWASGPDGGIETVATVEVIETGDQLDVLLEGGRIGRAWTATSHGVMLSEGATYALELVTDRAGNWRAISAQREGPTPTWDVHGKSWAHHADPVEEPFVLNAASFPADEDAVESEFIAALETWSIEGHAAVHLGYGGRTTDSEFGGGNNDSNTVMYDDYYWSSSTLAMARYNGWDGELTDCDVQIYGGNLGGDLDWSFDPSGAPDGEFDFRHTITHELGHCLGLLHSDDDDAMMKSKNSSGTGDERRHLAQDDIDGLQWLYGEAHPVVTVDATTPILVGVDPALMEVTLSNVGDARSYHLALTVAGEGVQADGGDTLPILSVGESIVIEIDLTALSCTDGTADVVVTVDDAGGHFTEATFPVDLTCPDSAEPGDTGGGETGEPAGCGCHTGGLALGWLFVPLALVSRRRGPGSMRPGPDRGAADHRGA